MPAGYLLPLKYKIFICHEMYRKSSHRIVQKSVGPKKYSHSSRLTNTHTLLRITDLVCSEQKWSEIKTVYCAPLVNTRPSSPIVKSWHTLQSNLPMATAISWFYFFNISSLFQTQFLINAIWLSPCPHITPLPDSSLSNTHRWPLKKDPSRWVHFFKLH